MATSNVFSISCTYGSIRVKVLSQLYNHLETVEEAYQNNIEGTENTTCARFTTTKCENRPCGACIYTVLPEHGNTARTKLMKQLEFMELT